MYPERRMKPPLRPDKITNVTMRPDFHKLSRLLGISPDRLSFQFISEDDPTEDTTFLGIY
jgi:hypothetical protein